MNIELFGQQLGADIVKTCDDVIEVARNQRVIKGLRELSQGSKMNILMKHLESLIDSQTV